MYYTLAHFDGNSIFFQKMVSQSKNGFSIKKWFLNQKMVTIKWITKIWFLNQKMVSQNMVSQSLNGLPKNGFSIIKWFYLKTVFQSLNGFSIKKWYPKIWFLNH